MTAVQEFAAYCEENGMPPDAVMSAAFYANSRKLAGKSGSRPDLTAGEWNDLLDFISPDVAPDSCPLA